MPDRRGEAWIRQHQLTKDPKDFRSDLILPARFHSATPPGYRIPADEQVNAGLQFAHPDYASGYQVVSLLHPNGETHHVAIPSGTDLIQVVAAFHVYVYGFAFVNEDRRGANPSSGPMADKKLSYFS